MSVSPALRRHREADLCELPAILVYTVRSILKENIGGKMRH